MSAYCAAKAGVEALSDCLRIEMQPFGVQVGVAYFLFLDTDMVRDGEREMPLLQRAKAEMPSFLSRTYPLPPAIDEVVAAIAERRRRVAYPRWFMKALADPPAVRLAVGRAPSGEDGARGDAGLRADGRRARRERRVRRPSARASSPDSGLTTGGR